MAFRLKNREPLGHGLARLYQKQGTAALEGARRKKVADPVEQVHDIRKRLKKMRAVLRLVRKQLGDGPFRTENQRLRDGGRLLSPLRDAEVRLHTFDKLRERFGLEEKRFPETRRALSREATLRRKHAGDVLAELAAALEIAVAEGSKFRLRGFGSDELCDSLLRSHRKARAAFRAACEESTHDRLHELRKQTKDLWYDLRLLERCFPEVLKEQARQLKQLTSVLGDYLDLSVLQAAIPDSAPLGKRLCHLIEMRQARLQRAALELATLFFEEKPKHFAKRISGYCQEDRCGAAE